jgi:dienelactone hydrolase
MGVFVAFTASAEPAIRIDPGPVVLDGNPIHLSIAGVPPGTEVTLSAQRWFAPVSTQRPRPRLFRSEAVFRADDQGRVDLRSAPSLRGTFVGPDPRGMFWSMQPVAGVERAAPESVDTSEVRFELHVATKREATARVRLLPSLPEVKTIAVESLPGAVFATLPGATKRPAIVIIGGSEGGSLATTAAAPLASHGFAVLALPVFSPPDPRTGAREIPALPAAWADMPVETLDRARAWLATRPEVDSSRIGLHGTSMGALLVLLGAAHLQWPAAVVASVPSDLVWDGWGPGVELGTRSTFSLRGKPLPFVPLVGYEEEMKGFERNEPVILRRTFEQGRAKYPDRVAPARVPVERIRVPILVIGGDDDQMWPSGSMARNIVESRKAAGLKTEALIFRDAGHSLYDTGYAPTTTYNTGLRKTGGTPEANARAQAEAWTRTIEFLRRALATHKQ